MTNKDTAAASGAGGAAAAGATAATTGAGCAAAADADTVLQASVTNSPFQKPLLLIESSEKF
eukprot:19244-Heterococcus_DN1.PRE.1